MADPVGPAGPSRPARGPDVVAGAAGRPQRPRPQAAAAGPRPHGGRARRRTCHHRHGRRREARRGGRAARPGHRHRRGPDPPAGGHGLGPRPAKRRAAAARWHVDHAVPVAGRHAGRRVVARAVGDAGTARRPARRHPAGAADPRRLQPGEGGRGVGRPGQRGVPGCDDEGPAHGVPVGFRLGVRRDAVYGARGRHRRDPAVPGPAGVRARAAGAAAHPGVLRAAAGAGCRPPCRAGGPPCRRAALRAPRPARAPPGDHRGPAGRAARPADRGHPAP